MSEMSDLVAEYGMEGVVNNLAREAHRLGYFFLAEQLSISLACQRVRERVLAKRANPQSLLGEPEEPDEPVVVEGK